jgi:pimeloyl-ACP methyl ester carboxylesterase
MPGGPRCSPPRRTAARRYDERGTGLSDRDVADFSFEAFVRDLETVVDQLGLQRFALLGISQGAPVSIAYAVRHPERVSRLVLCGGFAKGWRRRGNAGEVARAEASVTLIREGWGQDNPAARQMFTSLIVPDATHEEMRWFHELERLSASADTAIRLLHVLGDIDVTELLPSPFQRSCCTVEGTLACHSSTARCWRVASATRGSPRSRARIT